MRGLVLTYLWSLSVAAGTLQPCTLGSTIQPRVHRAPVIFHGLAMKPSTTFELDKNAQTPFWLIEVYKGSKDLAKFLDTQLPPETTVLDVRDR